MAASKPLQLQYLEDFLNEKLVWESKFASELVNAGFYYWKIRIRTSCRWDRHRATSMGFSIYRIGNDLLLCLEVIAALPPSFVLDTTENAVVKSCLTTVVEMTQEDDNIEKARKYTQPFSARP